MPWNKGKTKYEHSPDDLIFKTRSAQDITPRTLSIYDYDYFMNQPRHHTPTFLADHITRAVLGKDPEWLLTIRKVLRDLSEKACLNPDSDIHIWGKYSALLTVISCFLQRSNLITLT